MKRKTRVLKSLFFEGVTEAVSGDGGPGYPNFLEIMTKKHKDILEEIYNQCVRECKKFPRKERRGEIKRISREKTRSFIQRVVF